MQRSHASPWCELEALEARVLLNGDVLPDLTAQITVLEVPAIITPGISGKAEVDVTNITDAPLKEKVTVTLYLSDDDVFDAGDTAIGTKRSTVKLGLNDSKTFKIKYDVPDTIIAGEQFFFAMVDTENVVAEADETNNVASNAQPTDGGLEISDITGQNLRFFTGTGLEVRVKLSGAGTVTLSEVGVDEFDVTVAGTDSGSKLDIDSLGGGVKLRNVMIDGDLKQFLADTSTLTGDMLVTGGIDGKVNLAEIADDHHLTIGALAGASVDLFFGGVTDLVLNSLTAIGRLEVHYWHDAGGEKDAIVTPSIDRVLSFGDFEADITTSIAQHEIQRLEFHAALRNATIRTLGSIRNVTAGALISSRIYAGMNPLLDGVPVEADFLNPLATIGYAAIGSTESAQSTFVGSIFAAARFAKFTGLGHVMTTNSDVAHGVFAGRVNLLLASAAGEGIHISSATNSSDSFVRDDFHVTIFDGVDEVDIGFLVDLITSLI